MNVTVEITAPDDRCSHGEYPRSLGDRNWLHGHWGFVGPDNAGATFYDGPNTLTYTIRPDTNWVVACGRNIQTAGSAGTIINGVVTSVASGGTGRCEISINQIGVTSAKETSDWQLSKVYVWNTHLPDAVFADASARLNSYLAGACNAGFSGPVGGPCTACEAGKYKVSTGSDACTDCGAGTNQKHDRRNCDASARLNSKVAYLVKSTRLSHAVKRSCA